MSLTTPGCPAETRNGCTKSLGLIEPCVGTNGNCGGQRESDQLEMLLMRLEMKDIQVGSTPE